MDIVHSGKKYLLSLILGYIFSGILIEFLVLLIIGTLNDGIIALLSTHWFYFVAGLAVILVTGIYFGHYMQAKSKSCSINVTKEAINYINTYGSVTIDKDKISSVKINQTMFVFIVTIYVGKTKLDIYICDSKQEATDFVTKTLNMEAK